MTVSDLIQYAIIAVVAAYSLWRLARPYMKRKPGQAETEGGCGTGEGCGSCKGCGALSALSADSAPKK